MKINFKAYVEQLETWISAFQKQATSDEQYASIDAAKVHVVAAITSLEDGKERAAIWFLFSAVRSLAFCC